MVQGWSKAARYTKGWLLSHPSPSLACAFAATDAIAPQPAVCPQPGGQEAARGGKGGKRNSQALSLQPPASASELEGGHRHSG